MIAASAGIMPEHAAGAMSGAERLPLGDQLRLADVTTLLAPDHARAASRLRAQALAARSYEAGDSVKSHRDAPAERWERITQLRR